MLTINLPFPPSVNTYWGFRGHRRFLSKKALDFNASVRATLYGQQSLGDQRLFAHILLCPPNRRTRDIDNFVKSLLDALVHAQLFKDDSQIDLLLVERGPVVPKGTCTVTLYVDLHDFRLNLAKAWGMV